jgi:hypothetical protein
MIFADVHGINMLSFDKPVTTTQALHKRSIRKHLIKQVFRAVQPKWPGAAAISHTSIML